VSVCSECFLPLSLSLSLAQFNTLLSSSKQTHSLSFASLHSFPRQQ
jgi:hypothetical protein